MRKLTVLLLTLAMFLLLVPAASAAIHPIVCSGNTQGNVQANLLKANGVADHAARSDDIGNPPGITPDGDGPFGVHDDVLEAADNNPSGPSVIGLSNNSFAPLVHTDDTGPAWDKDCGPTP